eukprot:TRINITY_DN18623_c0_g1_i1.p1 TRINITY_DN18623_c0_g1~~TRINITY_DN18623_c0_g1_i1.p1  ORF type:complete len:433 (-),score=51.59 TRINITY_DN18623_c0_g1_i1:84-1382(-)
MARLPCPSRRVIKTCFQKSGKKQHLSEELRRRVLDAARELVAKLVQPGLFSVVDEKNGEWWYRKSQNQHVGQYILANHVSCYLEGSEEFQNTSCHLRPQGRQPCTFPPQTPKQELKEGTSSNYEELFELGSGSFGRVSKARNTDSLEYVAVKEVKSVTDAMKEVGVMQELGSHRNVIHLIEAWSTGLDDDSTAYMVLPLAEGTLSTFMTANLSRQDFCANLSRQDFWCFVGQIAAGLQHIHDKYLVHCDLKPENILCYPGVAGEGRWNLRIADLGASRWEGSPFGHMYLCTRWYRAPEILLGTQLARASMDIWSLGIIAQELLYQRGPSLQGQNGVDQLVTIVAMNGPPTQDELCELCDEAGSGLLPQPLSNLLMWTEDQRAQHYDLWASLRSDHCALCPHGHRMVQWCVRYSPSKRPSAKSIKEYCLQSDQ